MPLTTRARRTTIGIVAIAPVLLLLAFLFNTDLTPSRSKIDLRLNASAVTCYNAVDIAKAFEPAVEMALNTPPDYSGVKQFGFSAPANPGQLKPLRSILQSRLLQVNDTVRAVARGDCTDEPKANIVDGTVKALPVVNGFQPMTPVSGSQSNDDPRTAPVTMGTVADDTRTNTWSELDELYGNESWYTQCANQRLAMNWDRDVPKYVSTENGHDNRFILAVNVDASLTDDQIREQAAADGNPKTGALKVVRTDSIINTRHFKQNRCDEFVDYRSMIRVSLGKVILDEKGNFKELKTDEGIFVDCHNMWRLPKNKPVPTPPTPGVTPPTKTPPTKTTPPTKPPEKCVPPAHENENGKCIVPKRAQDGAAHRGNVPEQVKGTNPPAGNKSEPRPKDPPKTYKPPAPPKDPDPKPTTTRPKPPPEQPAPKPEDPGTQGPCAPGIPSC